MAAALAALSLVDKIATRFLPRLQVVFVRLSTDKNLKPAEQKFCAETAAKLAQADSFLTAVNSL